jgi:DNA (cytosine-5)-methyltransferase 1
MAKKKYTTIDLFSGAGGLSLGFDNSKRFKPIFAVETDRMAAQTYAQNFGLDIPQLSQLPVPYHFKKPGVIFTGDIRKLDRLLFPADVLIGGPPCQGFSPLGKISPRDEHLRMNQLWQHYMRIVFQVRPLAFVIENVPAILRSKESKAITLLGQRMGYQLTSGELKAVEFGVPQRRVRAFIIGLLGSTKPHLPSPIPVRKTVRDAIGDLPLYPETTELRNVEPGFRQDLHTGRNPTELSIKRYKLIPPGGNRFDLMRRAPEITPRCWLNKPTGSTDVFGRLIWDKPAYTIRTEFFKPEKGCYLHPEAHRPLTHREAARLQTFTDDFVFAGSKTDVARQIGNAVPPLLGEYLAKSLANQLDSLPVDRNRENLTPGSNEDFNLLLEDVLSEVYGRGQLDLLMRSGAVVPSSEDK